jgi:2'-5' RNA ligase
VPTQRLAAIRSGLAVAGPRFELPLTDLESWPRGLVVLRPREVPGALLELHAALAAALGRLDLPLERRAFKPHVTLARRAPGITSRALVHPIRWPVRGYSLVVSDGAYRRIAEYRLG